MKNRIEIEISYCVSWKKLTFCEIFIETKEKICKNVTLIFLNWIIRKDDFWYEVIL